jgi:Mrp family chromosome partitioning ATPase
MMIACWSPKGGSGTSVTAAALALVSAEHRSTLLVDTRGDQPGVLGIPDPIGPGLGGWLRAWPDVPPGGLQRVETSVSSSLSLLPAGDPPAQGGDASAEVLAALLAADGRHVVIDAGHGATPVEAHLAARATVSLLVIRPCYVALRRARTTAIRASGCVVVREPGRALKTQDVERIVGVPVVAEVALDVSTARTIDSGQLASQLPRSMARALRSAA